MISKNIQYWSYKFKDCAHFPNLKEIDDFRCLGKLSSMHFHGWRLGLKTGMYYLRTKPAAQAIQFTVDKTKIKTSADTKLKAVCLTCPHIL